MVAHQRRYCIPSLQYWYLVANLIIVQHELESLGANEFLAQQHCHRLPRLKRHG